MKVWLLFLVLALTSVRSKHFLIQTKEEQGSENLPELEPETASVSSSPAYLNVSEDGDVNGGDDILDALEEEEKEQTGDDYIVASGQGKG